MSHTAGTTNSQEEQQQQQQQQLRHLDDNQSSNNSLRVDSVKATEQKQQQSLLVIPDGILVINALDAPSRKEDPTSQPEPSRDQTTAGQSDDR
jgi:hypothetical protein